MKDKLSFNVGMLMDENAFVDRELVVFVRCGEDSKVVFVECMATLVTMISYGRMKEGIDMMAYMR